MKLSKSNNLQYEESMDWFDPIIDQDTELFIDPFLLFRSDNQRFRNSHAKLLAFFTFIFSRVAITSRSNNPGYRLLKKALEFPEAQELCLGYTEFGIGGAGAGPKYGKQMLEAIYESIRMGVQDLNHFEELGIFNKGIGCDRISDITARLILPDLMNYTLEIARKYDFDTKMFRVDNAIFNTGPKRWEPGNFELPINKSQENLGVILVPKKILSTLPSIEAQNFYDFCWDTKNEDLRDQLSIDIKESLKKEVIVNLAKNNRTWVSEYVNYKENATPKPYDLVEDRMGVYNWHDDALSFALQNPYNIPQPKNTREFTTAIEGFLEKFENYVENNQGFKLLWNDNPLKPKPESAVQSLFMGLISFYCEANDIDISRESNSGRGPVDFKFSQGYSSRALLEIKKAGNSKFWSGLEKQLPKYMETENIKIGYFLVVVYNEKDQKKLPGIHDIANKLSSDLGYSIKVHIVDATYEKLSASNL